MENLIYVLTLKKNTDRNQLYKTLSYYDKINFFYGIDGTLIKNNNTLIPNGVIGCGISHILLWDNFVHNKNYNDDDYIIILENDTYIILEELEFIKSEMESLLQFPDTGIIFLFHDYFKSNENKNNKTDLFIETEFHFSMGAYVITKRTAKLLLLSFNNKKLRYHIDMDLNYRKIPSLNNNILKHYGLNNNLKKVSYQFSTNVNSTMTNDNNNKIISNLEIYKNFKVPLFKINTMEFNGFNLLLLLFILITIILNIFYINEYNRTIFIILYFIIGVFIWELV